MQHVYVRVLDTYALQAYSAWYSSTTLHARLLTLVLSKVNASSGCVKQWWSHCCWGVGPRKYYPKDADSKLAVVWLILVQPLLFGAIGIEIDFRLIQGSLIWKTIIILALGNLTLFATQHIV